MPGTGGRGPRGAGPGPVCKMSICPHRAGAGAGLHPAIFMDSREALCWSQEDRHLPRVGGPLRETAACRAAGTQDQLGTARPDPTGSAWEARVTGALDTITRCQEPRRRKNKWILGVAACGTGLVSKVAGTQKKKRKKKKQEKLNAAGAVVSGHGGRDPWPGDHAAALPAATAPALGVAVPSGKVSVRTRPRSRDQPMSARRTKDKENGGPAARRRPRPRAGLHLGFWARSRFPRAPQARRRAGPLLLRPGSGFPVALFCCPRTGTSTVRPRSLHRWRGPSLPGVRV